MTLEHQAWETAEALNDLQAKWGNPRDAIVFMQEDPGADMFVAYGESARLTNKVYEGAFLDEDHCVKATIRVTGEFLKAAVLRLNKAGYVVATVFSAQEKS